METQRCDVCFRHCELREGAVGFCGSRKCEQGEIRPDNYGRVTSLALDPIEKKPLRRFHPGSLILSVGSYGCNLRCPFCQNHEISWSKQALKLRSRAEYISPEELAGLAEYYRKDGNIGVAFTYNEPLIGYEYVLDTARLVKAGGMKTVLVTNGTAELTVLEKLGPFIDAMNVDLKGFTDQYYEKVLSGSRGMVMDFIRRAVQLSHVEITTLIVTGENDSEEEMREEAKWIRSLTDSKGNPIGKNIPLHVSRFFPRFHMTDREAAEVRTVYRLADIARKELNYVYTGNC